ncbi:Dihydroorotase [Tilletiopsis washingtonensis]|uniref:dihydroorotase n=1 Tax=Tilletiopsis washingtonensis TaxID=58919 RepID=A0A316Z2L4_9BASI|nr:Dihydroorotase [Tilletiopsis washingtonensis]PWN95324.1 Dihydroorotase [Tilletiopsis washingtonensis]
MPDTLTLPSPADFHVHLRAAPQTALLAPHVLAGGMHLAYVMPNLSPPLTLPQHTVAYLAHLRALAPEIDIRGTLFLSPALTPQLIREAAQAGIAGVKSYPRGVTTGSEGGIESYEVYYDVFEAMQQHGLVLNLHGEVPSDASKNISVLTAEATFLRHLVALHARFPRLRIVLEHATTRAAVECVKALGDTVGCTITPHHLDLTVDDWAGRPVNFCKPVAKHPDDREALRDVIRSGHPRFFLGSDSAPHPLAAKLPSAVSHGASALAAHACAAGIYTSPILLPLCATLLESFGALEQLAGYVSTHGRAFYGMPAPQGKDVTLVRRKSTVPMSYVLEQHQHLPQGAPEKCEVVPFWAGRELEWSLEP